MKEPFNPSRLVNRSNNPTCSVTSAMIKSLVATELRSCSTLKSLAHRLNANPETLRRIFRRETGQTVSHYLTQRQIDMMKTCLENTFETCEEIGKMCGFTRSDSACRFFKKMMGVTMTEYRISRMVKSLTQNWKEVAEE